LSGIPEDVHERKIKRYFVTKHGGGRCCCVLGTPKLLVADDELGIPDQSCIASQRDSYGLAHSQKAITNSMNGLKDHGCLVNKHFSDPCILLPLVRIKGHFEPFQLN
jgi:hypothetical protein